MRRARVMVLAIAFTAAVGAAWVAKKIVSGPREVETVEKTVGATDVLVAATDINLGDSVRADDLKWQQWPVEGVTPGLITHNAQPDAPTDSLWSGRARALYRRRADQGAEADQNLRRRRDGRHPSAGMRAISTPIREETSAGGFILFQRSRRCRFVAQDASGIQGGAGERGGTAQRARPRYRSGNREQGRRESGHWQDRDARARPSSSGGSRSGASRMGEISLSLRSLADAAPGQLKPPPRSATLTATRSSS